MVGPIGTKSFKKWLGQLGQEKNGWDSWDSIFSVFPNRFKPQTADAMFSAKLAKALARDPKARFERSEEPITVHGWYIMVITPLLESFENGVLGFVAIGIQFAALLEEVFHWVQSFRIIVGSRLGSGSAGRNHRSTQELAQAIHHEDQNPLRFGRQFIREMDIHVFDFGWEMDDAHSIHFRVGGVLEIGWMVRQKPVFALALLWASCA